MVVILILSILVLLHELGHYLTAVWLKIKVDEFSLGFPPKMVKLFSWKGTDFTLSWIPFGGFVRLHGEFIDADQETDLQAFHQKSVWQQVAVMLGGPMVNLVLAVLIFATVFSVGGIPVSLNHQPRIAEVVTGSPAAIAGLTSNTNLVGFKSLGTDPGQIIEIKSIADAQKFVADHRGETWLAITSGPCQGQTCSTETFETQLYFRTQAETPPSQGSMGIVFAEYEIKFYPWYEMPIRGGWVGLVQTYELTNLMLGELGKLGSDLISGKGLSQNVAGPIGIVHEAEKAGLGDAGILAIFNFAGMLSLNLAVINLLPIPALDGGRIMVVTLGYILGNKRISKFENVVNYGGFFFLVGLLLIISFRDVWKIWLER